MKKNKDRVDRLERSLGEIYRRNANERADAGDVDAIMRRARRHKGPGAARSGRGSVLAESLALADARRIFARFAAGTALAALAAAMYSLAAGYGPEYELLRMYALDPASLFILPLLGA